MRYLALGFFLLLQSCSWYWDRAATTQREAQLNCNAARAQAEPSTWSLLANCPISGKGDVLPPECMTSDDAVKSPKCESYVKAAMLGGMAQGIGTAGIAVPAGAAGAAIASH